MSATVRHVSELAIPAASSSTELPREPAPEPAAELKPRPGWCLLVPAGADPARHVAACPRPIVTIVDDAAAALKLWALGQVSGVFCARGTWQVFEVVAIESPEDHRSPGSGRVPRLFGQQRPRWNVPGTTADPPPAGGRPPRRAQWSHRGGPSGGAAVDPRAR